MNEKELKNNYGAVKEQRALLISKLGCFKGNI